MAQFRITIRHGKPHRYHVVDVDAADLRAAAAAAVAEMPDPAAGRADLLEIRLLNEAESRSYIGME